MTMKIKYDAPFTIIDRAVLMSEDLDVYDKAVYAILCSYASSTDRSCFPSYQTIANKSGCSRRKVISVIANLERLGLVEKQERFNSVGDNTSNLYIVKPMPNAGNSPPNASDTLKLYPANEKLLALLQREDE